MRLSLFLGESAEQPVKSARQHTATAAWLIGLLAALLVGGLWVLAPGLFASWEWSTYDVRLRLRGPAPVSPHLVIIGRDTDSDARFGVGVWDRARFARVIGALGQAGAAVVAPDFHFAGVSPPERGGTASDEALIEATKAAGNVVYPVSSSPLLPGLVERARGMGHMAALPDDDGVYRPMPVSLNVNGRAVPAFGVAIAAAFLRVSPDTITVPTDARGRRLINYAGRWHEGPFPYLSFVDVWDAVEEGRLEELRRLVSGKIVLLLQASLESDKRRTPLELKAPGGFIHANVINTILTGQTLRVVSPLGHILLPFILATLSAWVLLVVPGWRGMTLVAIVLLGYLGCSQALLALRGLVLPMLGPIVALFVSSGAVMVWNRAESVKRAGRFEADWLASSQELARTRERLTSQESLVERLDEDLATAQADAAASAERGTSAAQETEVLKTQLTGALAELAVTRNRMQALESKVACLRPASTQQGSLAVDDIEHLQQECEQMGILTRDPTLLRLYRDVKKAAASRTSILLLGETGTGKELFARAVHRLSPRANRPFVAVNVAAIAGDLVESELFGHLRGAFTGADRDRKGYFEEADHGTIFLDEIGDLSASAQAKLLRTLQDGTFYRVGATTPSRVDVRIVAATNRDLAQAVADGTCREDLYYRIRGIEFRLPPLRERKDDLVLLAQHLAKETAVQAGRSDLTLSESALTALTRWPWPGNVRELKQCIERAVTLADGPLISEQDLHLAGPGAEAASMFPDTGPQLFKVLVSPDSSGDAAVLAHLRAYGFDMQKTAQALGWGRSTVTQRLKGLCFHEVVKHGGDRRAAAVALAGERAYVKIVAIKVAEYVEHLLRVARETGSRDQAIKVCRQRFRNLPERYFGAVETLIDNEFEQAATQSAATNRVQDHG